MITEPDLIGDEPCCIVESSCANGPAHPSMLSRSDIMGLGPPLEDVTDQERVGSGGVLNILGRVSRVA